MKKELNFSILSYAKILFLLLGIFLLLSACAVNEPASSRAVSAIPAVGNRQSNGDVFSHIGPLATVQSSYDEETLRLHVELQSNTENIRKRYERAGMDVTEVSVIGGEVGLRRKDDDGKSYISVHEGLEEAFTELLGRQVSLTVNRFSNHYVVGFCLSSWETGGTGEICFPVTFCLAKTTEKAEPFTDEYQLYGEFRYKVTVRVPQKGITSFIIRSEKAVRSDKLLMQ